MCWDYNGLVGLTIEKVVGLSEGLFTPPLSLALTLTLTLTLSLALTRTLALALGPARS